MDLKIPIGRFGEAAIGFLNAHFKWATDLFGAVVLAVHGAITAAFQFLPPAVLIIAICLIAWRVCGWGLSLFGAIGLALLWNQGLWLSAVQTSSLVLTATLLSLAVALPAGVMLAELPRVERLVRPTLDFVQTMPRFVYLIPAAVIFGLDVVPSVFATMTLAVVPPIRIMSVGIRQVDPNVVEAAEAMGSSRFQVLWKVKLPLALPTIGFAVSQCLMLSLSMAVIAAFIGAGGLGADVLNAISTLDSGQGFVAGFGILVLAILIDRISAALVAPSSRLRELNSGGA